MSVLIKDRSFRTKTPGETKMRALLILTPIALVGGFAIQQAVTRPDICTEEVAKASHTAPVVVAVPAVHAVPAVPAVHIVPGVPDVPTIPDLEGLSHLATLSEDIEVRIPREALDRASRLAGELRLRAEAHADVEIALHEVMEILDEHLSEIDVAAMESLGDLGLSEDFFADLAASIQASVSVDVDDGGEVTVRIPKRRRQ